MLDIPQAILDRLAAGGGSVAADEVAHWPDGLLGQLLTQGILSPAENAKSVVCDACGQDHVEEVILVESPPRTGIRAYIMCPEAGRVRVDLKRLRQWAVDKSRLIDLGLIAPSPADDRPGSVAELHNIPPDVATKEHHNATGASGGTTRRGKRVGEKRSWTQTDLDDAIREYKAKRASNYRDLVDGVKRGNQGAKKSARQLFGRNAIVRALGVRSPAMVSNSTVWQQIADDLGLRGRVKKARRPQGQCIGLEIALEEKAVTSAESPVDQAIRQETIRLIEAAMPATEAEATLEKLHRGEITDDQAREVAELYAEQKQDDRSRKAWKVP